MKKINTALLSSDECWGVQINGLQHCQTCKWVGISACAGQNIRQTHFNAKGYRIGLTGLIPSEHKNAYSQAVKQ